MILPFLFLPIDDPAKHFVILLQLGFGDGFGPPLRVLTTPEERFQIGFLAALRARDPGHFRLRLLARPELVIEIVSPGDDTWKKLPFYAAHDVDELLISILPSFVREGKSYLTIAMGCTGGRHRSVALAEALGERLGGHGHAVSVFHRDVDR